MDCGIAAVITRWTRGPGARGTDRETVSASGLRRRRGRRPTQREGRRRVTLVGAGHGRPSERNKPDMNDAASDPRSPSSTERTAGSGGSRSRTPAGVFGGQRFRRRGVVGLFADRDALDATKQVIFVSDGESRCRAPTWAEQYCMRRRDSTGRVHRSSSGSSCSRRVASARGSGSLAEIANLTSGT